MSVYVLVLALMVGMAPANTVVQLERGDRVAVQNVSGEISVVAWDRGELRLSGEDAEESRLRLTRSGRRVVVTAGSRRAGRSVEFVLNVPRWVAVDVEGVSLDVEVSGLEADLSVSNVEGDIEVRSVRGRVSLSTVDGGVSVESVLGSVSVQAQADHVSLRDVTGDVRVTSGEGDVRLSGVDATHVFAETLGGDLTFSGRIAPAGTYEFSTHSGDLELTLPPSAGATVGVSTFDGDFESDFPVTVPRFSSGREFRFTVGDGSATLSIKVFNGEIRVRRGRDGS